MMQPSIHAQPKEILLFICQWLLPLGYLILLTGLAFLPDRNIYHKLFYLLIAAPTLVAIVLAPALLKSLFSEPIVIAFVTFSIWAIVSISWSNTDEPTSSLLKRPIYIFMLFSACTLLAQHSIKRLELTIIAAAMLMLGISIYSLIEFTTAWTPGSRLIGTGALDNPLLSSHLFGFFFVIWLGLYMTLPPNKYWIAIIPALIAATTLLATGSRTPLVAASLAGAWLTLGCWNKRSIVIITLGSLGLIALLLFYPEAITNRGSSYRFELWQAAFEEIALKPWLGFGFGAGLAIKLEDIPYAFSEPHSFVIGALYYTGIVGLTIWLTMHAFALSHCWRQKHNPLFIIAGALLIYGIGAGLTEGGGILARPKEHWFLIWIPLALIAALAIASRSRKDLQA